MRQVLFILSCVFISFLSIPAFANHSPDTRHQAEKPFKIDVLLNWNHQFEYAGFYAAIMQGYYANEGLDVTVHSWNRKNIVEEVVANKFQIGVAGSLALKDYVQGRPIKLLFSAFQYSPLVLLSQEPVTDLKQLKGKRMSFSESYETLSLLRRAGLSKDDIEYMYHSADLNKFIEKKTDFYDAYSTNEPFQLQEKNIPFHIVDPKTYGVISYGDLIFTSAEFAKHNPNEVQKFKEATLKGWEYALKQPESVIDYLIANYEVKKSKNALMKEAEASAAIIEPLNVAIGTLSNEKLKAIAKEMASLEMISREQAAQFDPNKFIFRSFELHLTEQEKSYLRNNPKIRIANDINWAPFEFIDKNGQYQGIIADYFHEFSEMLNVEFVPLTDTSWSQAVELMKKGELSLFSGAVATNERKKYARFTEPYLNFPVVLLGQEKDDFIPDIKQLKNNRIAVVKSYSMHEYLESHYPEIDLVLVNNIEEGIKAIQNGKAHVYAGNLASINFYLKQKGITNLKIVRQLEEQFALAIGVSHAHPELFSIMKKVIEALPDEEKNAIYNRWLNLKVIAEVDWSQLKIPIIVILLAFAFLLVMFAMQARYKKRLQKFVDKINELNYACTTDGRLNIIAVSDSLCELTGYSREELLDGNSCDIFVHPDDSKRFREDILNTIREGKTWQGELKGVDKNGKIFWVHTTYVPVMANDYSVQHVNVTRQDITSKKLLEVIAVKDELTQLYNRRHFNEILPKEWNRAIRHNEQLAMAMIDIDFFKCLNDNYGHQKGDEVLQKIARLLESYFNRSSDNVFRLGGEEFCALINASTPENTQEFFDKLCQVVENLGIENTLPDGSKTVLTLSIGIASYSAENMKLQNPNTLYQKADSLLYVAKETGRNRAIMDLENTPNTKNLAVLQ